MVGLIVLAGYLQPLTVAEFDAWAKQRDVASIVAHADESLADKFTFLKRAGAFGVGQSGWRAEEIKESGDNKRYVVFTTALTTQDYGDQVFEWDGTKLTKLIHERETRGVRVRKATLDLQFDVPKKSTTISAKIDFEKSGASEPIFFVRLGDNYKVSSATDSNGKAVKFVQAGGVVSLPTGSGKEFSYTLNYSGVVNRPRFAGAIVDDEVMLTNDYWWPHIGRLPMKLTTTTHVPKDWVVVAQGNKGGEKISGEEKAVTYVNDLPVSYMSLSAGKFGYREKERNGITYFVASRELSNEEMDDQIEYVAPVIEFFSTLHPHPYKVYGAVDTPLYGGGALEAYSYATYGTGWLPAEDAHEPSHTWWGGVIPNTYLDSFWNESFAVFSEGLYAREGAIGDKEAKRRAFVKPANANGAYNQGTPFGSGAESGGIASTMGYGKGGDILEQLEFEMGTPKMTEVLKTWLGTHVSGEAGGWTEFEKVCGPEWKWFFDQWIRRTGWPKLTIEEPKNGPGAAHITMKQEAPFYRFKMEYAVKQGSDWVYGSVDVVPDDSGVCELIIPVRGEWDVISLDPFDRVLLPNRPREPIRWEQSARQMQVYDPKGLVESRRKVETIPADISNVMLVGTPTDVPESAKYWAMAGFTFEGDKASYKGVSIDLAHGAAVAIVEYEPGKFMGLRAGKTKYDPNVGIASAGLVDEMGRFLTGTTVPRTNGPLVRMPFK